MNFICRVCKEGYIFNSNHECVEDKNSTDCSHILGCSVCSTVDRKKCHECDSENNFVGGGRMSPCVCIDGYDLVDKKCLPPIPPVIPPKGPKPDKVDSIDKASEPGKIYEMDVSNGASELRLPPNCENMVFNFLDEITKTVPIIPPKENTVVTLDVSNGGNFQIDHTNKKTKEQLILILYQNKVKKLMIFH